MEVNDDIYERFTELISGAGKRGDPGYSWKHFELWPSGVADWVSIRQSETMISDGTTGLHCWQAAGALAEWCMANREQLRGRKVLELGSGTGLTGLVVAKVCAPARIVLSDGNEKVLALLRENVAENFKEKDNIPVEVTALDWEDVDVALELLDGMRPDVVLAADVVYDDVLFGPLCHAIEAVFRRSGKDCRLIIACTLRNETTLNEFLKQLGECQKKVPR